MNDTDTITVNTVRLLDLGRWLTKEERARREGRPSHWNQSVWVQVDEAEDAPPIDVLGDADGLQPQLIRWSCGTAACAAGHISLEDGGAPAFRYDGEYHPTPRTTRTWDWLGSLSASEMFFGGRLETIEDHGQRALGLDDDQARLLFHGDNTWDVMVEHISDFTGIPEARLLELIGAEDMPADPDDEDEEDW